MANNILTIHDDYILIDDKILPITDMYNSKGNKVNNINNATTLVAGSDELGWYSVELTSSEEITLH